MKDKITPWKVLFSILALLILSIATWGEFFYFVEGVLFVGVMKDLSKVQRLRKEKSK